MRTTNTALRTSFKLTLVTVLIAALAVSGTGCTRDKEPELRSYGEPGGLFHVKVRTDWLTTVVPSMITIYAGEEYPTEETFDALSILIFTGDMDDVELGEKLQVIIENRAEQREWQDFEIDDAEDVVVGNRRAVRRHVSGTDMNGIAFNADYTIVRSNGKEFLAIAMAPADSWEEDRDAARDLVENHVYWHVPDPAVMVDPSAEDTVTPVGTNPGPDEGDAGGNDAEGATDAE